MMVDLCSLHLELHLGIVLAELECFIEAFLDVQALCLLSVIDEIDFDDSLGVVHVEGVLGLGVGHNVILVVQVVPFEDFQRLADRF